MIYFDYRLVLDVHPSVAYSEDQRLDHIGAFVVYLVFGGPSLAVYFEVEVLQLLMVYFEVLNPQVCFDLRSSVVYFEVLDLDLEACLEVLELEDLVCLEVLELEDLVCLEVLELEDLLVGLEVLELEDLLVCFEVRLLPNLDP